MSIKKSKPVNYRKLFSFAVMFMFVFAFSASIVMAAPILGTGADGKSGADLNIGVLFDGISGPFSKFIDGWNNGVVSTGLSKFLFWALVSMIVYSVSSKIPGLSNLFDGNKQFLGIVFSAIVGFLSMYAISPQVILSMLTSYTAMGFVLGAFLPFIILMTFTISLATAKGGATQKLTSKFIAIGMWIAFTVFIFARVGGAKAAGSNPTLDIIIGIVSIVTTITMSTIFKKIRKALLEETLSEAKNVHDKATTNVKLNALDVDEVAKGLRKGK